MEKMKKEQSNPYSTGSGGANFETHVQAAFAVLMLTGRIAPCLPPWPIKKIILQGLYAGFETDDFIVIAKDSQTNREAKLLAQIKHTISITKSDETFGEVIKAAWNDFNNPEIFSPETDSFALITGPLTATDTNSVRPLLEWARHSENEKEFLVKVYKEGFSSDTKRDKLDAFRTHLQNANKGELLSDQQLWKFLKRFYLLGYDFDSETSSAVTLLQSLIAQSSTGDPLSIWAKLVNEVKFVNQDAGTLSLDTLPKEILQSFDIKTNSYWASDIRKLQEHGNYILNNIRSSIGGAHIKRSDIFEKLLETSEEHNFILLTGDRGHGKSSLIKEFAECMKDSTPIFCIRTEELGRAHLDNVFSSIGLRSSLSDLEAGFVLMPKKYLLIESLEKLLELENSVAFSDLLQFVKKDNGWTIIASGRDYAYQQISFNYLQPSGINYSLLTIDGFSDNDIQQLCEELEILKPFADNPSLKPLLKNPFYAELAYRVAISGTKFSVGDGEKEFKEIVWRDIISKESERSNGMPLKRRQTFIEISVRRAKQMVYGVSDNEFDPEALLRLEADNLIRRDSSNNLVSPAHDILEDWGLESYIESKFKSSPRNVNIFLSAVGHEPAMNRAFRLWLYQKLRYGENVKQLIFDILDDREIESCWQDETITAVLLSENPYGFLYELNEQLFENDCDLLMRFCFILRISCKTPDQKRIKQLYDGKNEKIGILSTLYLKPHGNGWNDIIHFLFENRENISKELIPHLSAVLEEWSSSIHVDKNIPAISREVGLLALYLLNFIKDTYGDEVDRKKLLSVIVKVVPVIQQELSEMLETDLFTANIDRRQPLYLDDFNEMALNGIETAFLCKYVPDMVIKLAFHQWVINNSKDNEDDYDYYYRDDEECFGLQQYQSGCNFFPPSGARGPFRYLLRYHPRKGLDFIIKLLNVTAEIYANSGLDSPKMDSPISFDVFRSEIKQVEINLNDGTSIKQYCSQRLWSGYRGLRLSVVPNILQSALMALENWLIYCAEVKTVEYLEKIFDYILRNSNSVLPTAVLSSVATGFPDKLGKAALPLLRVSEFYDYDLTRSTLESGKDEPDSFDRILNNNLIYKICTEERHTSALRPWRRKNLEHLISYLQFSYLREDIFIILDELRFKNATKENWCIRFHRIDTREWKPKIDKENSRIVFTTDLEPELKESQKKAEEDQILNDRMFSLFLWSEKTLKGEKLDREYYSSLDNALEEAKNLFEILKDQTPDIFCNMLYGCIIKVAVIFLRDYSNEMDKEDLSWCIDLIIHAVLTNADTENHMAIVDKTDHNGEAASASILPIIFDFVSENEDIYIMKKTISTALTHANENVRIKAAIGIRDYLWQRDPAFAQNCIIGAIEYARLNTKEYRIKRVTTTQLENFGLNSGSDLNISNSWINNLRDQIAHGLVEAEINNIDFRCYNIQYLLTSFIIVPNGSTDPSHISLLSQMLVFLFEAEETKNNTQKNKIEIPYKFPMEFCQIFAEYLFYISDSNTEKIFIEKLQAGCDSAPSFINSLLIWIHISAEKTGRKDRYWWFWRQLSEPVQKIAIKIAKGKSRRRQVDDERELIRHMLFADIRNQHVDHERNNIQLGKDSIEQFVINAGINPDVFEAMSSLMFYYPEIFLESGLLILSKHQEEIGGTELFSRNTVFYLEIALSRYLLFENTALLSKEIYDSYKILLDAIVKTGSSRAYYLRENLIRARRVVN
ncbi:ATP-binding protein [Methanosarcina mazei]|uniref:ATP-binding protein n=2 Tax=Methanosarcina mazei TaxID=2209 RepID=A0A0F8E5M3_METMZ|nr:ATP-binding protein [Methanosarcina mazei]KKG36017.1 hypothetical protein DU30_16425 [Methanosarcina mazei]WIM46415.1 ATP-binding protein [Methanosarcina mazei]